jgi:YVTN family beta-propeller protein
MKPARCRFPCVLDLLAFCSSIFVLGCSGAGAHHSTGTPSTQGPSSKPIDAIDYDALFVVNGGDSTISVIDADANEVVSTIELTDASFPHHLYLSPDGSQMALAVPGMDLSMGHSSAEHASHGTKGLVMLLDATTGATLRSRVLDSMNHNAVFSPAGAEIWTSQMAAAGTVLILDADTLELEETVEVGSQPAEVTFSADGAYAFVANGGSESVTVIDAMTKQVVQTIEVDANPVGAWQGANGLAYVDNESDESLSVIDTGTLEVTHTYELGFMPGMAALGPDEQVWVTDAENGRVVFYAMSGGEANGELATGAGAHAIAFSADGSTAYVSNQLEDTVSVIDLPTASVVTTIRVGARPNALVWRAR